jgi:hypothetical protein
VLLGCSSTPPHSWSDYHDASQRARTRFDRLPHEPVACGVATKDHPSRFDRSVDIQSASGKHRRIAQFEHFVARQRRGPVGARCGPCSRARFAAPTAHARSCLMFALAARASAAAHPELPPCCGIDLSHSGRVRWAPRHHRRAVQGARRRERAARGRALRRARRARERTNRSFRAFAAVELFRPDIGARGL